MLKAIEYDCIHDERLAIDLTSYQSITTSHYLLFPKEPSWVVGTPSPEAQVHGSANISHKSRHTNTASAHMGYWQLAMSHGTPHCNRMVTSGHQMGLPSWACMRRLLLRCQSFR